MGSLVLAIACLMVILYFGPGTAMLFAWDFRRTKPALSRKLARIAMMGAAVSVGASVGIPLALIDQATLRMEFLWNWGWIVAVAQSVVFAFAWLASRAPRALRPETEDQA